MAAEIFSPQRPAETTMLRSVSSSSSIRAGERQQQQQHQAMSGSRKRKLEAAGVTATEDEAGHRNNTSTTSSDSEDEGCDTATTTTPSKRAMTSLRRRKPRRRRRGGRRSGDKTQLSPLKSYYELTESERSGLEAREQQRANRRQASRLAEGRLGAGAPYNTNQFILFDRQTAGGDEDVQRLEQRLAAAVTKQRRRRPGGLVRPLAEIFEDPVVKEEAVSVEDEEGNDDIYEDGMGDILEEEEEEEQAAAAFLSQQFRRDYDRLNADRLERLAKEAIIQEYLVLEKTVERLEGRLEAITAREEDKARRGEADYEFHRGEVPMEPDMAAKIRIFQAEIGRLGAENARLLAENGDLQSQLLLRHLDDEDDDCSSSSSSSSSGSSSSTSSSSSSEVEESTASSEDEEDDQRQFIAEFVEGLPKMEEGAKTDDTGYESTQSKEQTPEREVQSSGRREGRPVAADI